MGWFSKFFRKDVSPHHSTDVSSQESASRAPDTPHRDQGTNIEISVDVGTLLIPTTIGYKDQIENTQIGTVRISQDSIELADGTVILLSDIKEISAPKTVLGHPNHPLTEAITTELGKGHGFVYLLCKTSDRPSVKIIPTSDHSAAIALAARLKHAKIAADRQVSDRIVVGDCIKCHRKLRVRAHAVRPEMVLTCKCGEKNRVHTNKGSTK